MKAPIFLLLFFIKVTLGHVYNAAETELFAIPISPNLFNWTYQEFDDQYDFHASLISKPELPQWMRYIYSGRHHSGFIFGTPPRNFQFPIMLEVIGLNRQDYETRRVVLVLYMWPKKNMAKHEVELKIDNLNVDDLLDEHRMNRLKDIFRTKLWVESAGDLYVTFLASALDLGARLPLKPGDGEGLVVRFGSSVPFSSELKRLREEVRPLSRLPSCPRDFKRTTVERLFRDTGFNLDWCSFELYNTIYKERSTERLEYLKELPNSSVDDKPGAPHERAWTTWSRHALPARSYANQLTEVLAAPAALLLISVAALSAVLCFHYGSVNDPESEQFLAGIYHLCADYGRRRSGLTLVVTDRRQTGEKSAKVEICRYGTGGTDRTHVGDDAGGSVGDSPNNSLARPYSPKSTTNLASNYNRPQPPPYAGSANSTLHHRQSAADETPPAPRTPEHTRGHLALEESLQLLNEANITNELDNLILRNKIIDLNDGSDDYVPMEPDQTGYTKPEINGYTSKAELARYSMKNDLDDIVVPELAKYGIDGIGKI